MFIQKMKSNKKEIVEQLFVLTDRIVGVNQEFELFSWIDLLKARVKDKRYSKYHGFFLQKIYGLRYGDIEVIGKRFETNDEYNKRTERSNAIKQQKQESIKKQIAKLQKQLNEK